MGSSTSSSQEALRTGLRDSSFPWMIVALIVATKMAGAAPNFGLPLLYPFIQEDLDLSLTQVGLITSSLGAGGIATAFIGGWLADAVGVRRVMSLSLVLAGALLSLLPVGPVWPVIMGLAFLAGMAITPEILAGINAILGWVPRRARGLSMSVRTAGGPLGGAVIAGILPPIAAAFGWGVGAVVLGGLIMLVGIVFWAFYRDSPREGPPMPLVSMAIVRAFTQNLSLSVATLWGGVYYSLNFIMPAYFVLYLTDVMDLSVAAAGGYLGIAYVTSIFGRIMWGAISDFVFGSRRVIVMTIIGLLCSVALVGVSLLEAGTPSWVLVVLSLFLGLTTLAWGGVYNIAVAEMAGPAHSGATLGAVETLMRVGGIPLPALFGLLVDVTDSYTFTWAATAAMIFTVTVVSSMLVKEPQRA